MSDRPTAVDLLPCPYCGWHLIELTHALGEYWCRCHKCSASTRACASVHDAVAAWNRRAHSPAVRELVEAARNMCGAAFGSHADKLIAASVVTESIAAAEKANASGEGREV